MFGSGSKAADANAAATPAIALPSNFECPPVNVRSGASTLTSSAEAGEPTATSLRYQVGISNSARECRGAPGNMVAVKVGIQGRVILGPQGSPGTIDVPIRYAVVFDVSSAADRPDQARAHFGDGPAGREQCAVLARGGRA